MPAPLRAFGLRPVLRVGSSVLLLCNLAEIRLESRNGVLQSWLALGNHKVAFGVLVSDGA
jgi:hypothetical protein